MQPGSTGPPESTGPARLSSEQVFPEGTAGLSHRGHTRRGGLLGLEGDRWVPGSRGQRGQQRARGGDSRVRWALTRDKMQLTRAGGKKGVATPTARRPRGPSRRMEQAGSQGRGRTGVDTSVGASVTFLPPAKGEEGARGFFLPSREPSPHGVSGSAE